MRHMAVSFRINDTPTTHARGCINQSAIAPRAIRPELSRLASALAISEGPAIGAQNLFVLRQGLKREHVGPIVLFCARADAILIAAGVSGVGAPGSDAATHPGVDRRRRNLPDLVWPEGIPADDGSRGHDGDDAGRHSTASRDGRCSSLPLSQPRTSISTRCCSWRRRDRPRRRPSARSSSREPLPPASRGSWRLAMARFATN